MSLRTYVLSFSMLLLLACRKTIPADNSNNTPTPITPITPTPVVNKFISRAPIYGSPNNTVGQIKNGYFFPGFYNAFKEWMQYCIFGPTANGTGSMNQFAFDATGGVNFDFNNDGILDYFSFLQNFYNPPPGSQGGKYLFIKDVLNTTKQEIANINSTTRWCVRLEVNDVNNDGKNELIQANQDGHGLADGSHGTESPFRIIYFNTDGTFSIKEVGPAMGIHDFSSGDVDLDGDIDILVWRYNTSIGDSRPILFINDGSGNFTLDSSNSRFIGIDNIVSKYGQYVLTTVELFDLNKDGYLDIVTGQNIGQGLSPGSDYRHPNCRIYWGNSKSTFDLSNTYSDLPNTSITNSTVPVTVLGLSFLDYDSDGDYDVFVVSTAQYNGFYLQLYENTGSGMFKDITSTNITGFSHLNQSGANSPSNNFPNFYNIRLYDVDKDGDFDLIPDQLALPPNSIVTNMYWENINGKFTRRNF